MGVFQTRFVENPDQRFALIFPSGGLNDVLCAIEVALVFCEKNNRVLVVDSTYSHIPARHLDSIFDLTKVGDLIFRLDDVDRRLIRQLSDEVGRAGISMNIGSGPFDSIRLRSQHGRDLSNRLVVLKVRSGGRIGHHFVRRAQFVPEIHEALVSELAQIGSSYVAVHVRNTDYESDFQGVLKWAARKFQNLPIVLATDSFEARDAARLILGKRLVDFKRYLDRDGRPLHKAQENSSQELEERLAQELVLDLLLISLAARQVFTLSYGVWNSARPVISGFLLLALGLSREPSIQALRGPIGAESQRGKYPKRYFVLTLNQVVTIVKRLKFLNFMRKPYSYFRKIGLVRMK